MKWREPWTISLKQQRPLNLLDREVLIGMAVWTALFAAIMLVANVGENLSVQLERAANLWMAPAFGVPLAIFKYVVEWLSPRNIDSGPNGIVVSKGEHIALIPWQTIETYSFTRSPGHLGLHIDVLGGVSFFLFFANTVHPEEVERELVKMTGNDPIVAADSFQRASSVSAGQ